MYRAVIVENVVDVVFWPPFQAWRMAMESIGYVGQMVYLNSMHAQLLGRGAPQSRDRFYAIFTRAGDPRPDVKRVVSPTRCAPTADRSAPSKASSAPTAHRGVSTAPSTSTAAPTSRAATR